MKKNTQYNKGEIDFGMIIVLFIVGLFVIWLISGGPKKEEQIKPFIKPEISGIQ